MCVIDTRIPWVNHTEIIGSAKKEKEKKSCVEMDQQLLAQVELHPLTSSFK